MSDASRKVLTVEQATALLPAGDLIHTFRSGPGLLIGCDHPRASLIDDIAAAKFIEIAGPAARAMKHGLAIDKDDLWLFVATREDVDWDAVEREAVTR